jgi:nitrate reductase NapE component
MDATGQVRYGTATLFTPETLPKTVVEPGFCAVKTPLAVSAVITFAVPLHVAVPVLSVAVVGGVVAPYPDAVTFRCVPAAIVFAPVKVTVAAAPTTEKPRPVLLISAVMTFAVPLHVAVPLPSVAVVGGVMPPDPSDVIVRCVPLAIVFVPVSATDAVAPVTPLKFDKLQVWPAEPVIAPPDV